MPVMVVRAARLKAADKKKMMDVSECLMPQKYGKNQTPPNSCDRQLKTLTDSYVG
jgi:hypothetical protein